MLLADFLNENAGLWAFAALPLMVLAVIAAVTQALPALRTVARDEDRNFDLLRQRIRRRRVDSDLNPRLVLGQLLEARLSPRNAEEEVSVAQLYDSVAGGAQALVVGEAGAGKTILALTLVSHSTELEPMDREGPIMETISLRDWQERPWGTDEWKSLLRWMARKLDATYPTFGQRYFRRLLETHRLIPCLDGLDEVPASRRGYLLGALSSYAGVGLPLVVLSRDPSTLSTSGTVEAEEGRRPGFDVFELRSLAEEAILGVVEARPAWKNLAPSSRQPHRTAHLLRNPLRLSVATQTWGPTERPTALTSAADPEDALWSTFFDRTLGPRADAGAPARQGTSLRRTAGSVAALASQVDGSSFRPADLYKSSIATWLTLAVCAVPVLFSAWQLGSFALGVVLVIALAVGLCPERRASLFDRGWVARRVDRLMYGRSSLAQTAVLALVVAALVVAIFVLATFFANFVRYAAAPLPLADWWDESGRWVLGNLAALPTENPLLLVGVGCLFSWTATIDLTSRSEIRQVLPRKAPQVTAPVLGAIGVALGIAAENPAFAFIGAVAAAPWIFLLTSRIALAWQGHIPKSGLSDGCAALAAAGTLYAHDGTYRFRHGELSRRLARETFLELCEDRRLGDLLLPARTVDFVERRFTQACLEIDETLTSHAAAICKHDESLITSRTLYLYYGALRPADVLGLVQNHVRELPRSVTRVHIAEALDALGRTSEAWKIWSELAKAYPRAIWFLNRWVRRLALAGEPQRAIDLLKQSLELAPIGAAPFTELLLAELRCRFGAGDEFSGAMAALDRLRLTSDPYIASRAAMELARLHAESFGEFEQARKLLGSPLEKGPLDGLRFARSAQLDFAQNGSVQAEALAREAYGLIEWGYDPTHQLEVFVTAACLSDCAEAEARAKALIRFGWRLCGRTGSLLNGCPSPAETLVAEAFLGFDSQLEPKPI